MRCSEAQLFEPMGHVRKASLSGINRHLTTSLAQLRTGNALAPPPRASSNGSRGLRIGGLRIGVRDLAMSDFATSDHL
eukprot:14073782-Alexandrium_andersonii.AAC.1